MAYIDWSPLLSVNVDAMDKQHQILIGYINDLHHGLVDGGWREQLLPLLEKVVDYTKEHFRDEEEYMRSIGAPNYDAHCARHRELTDRAVEFFEDARAGKDVTAAELLSFLKSWLINHIQKTDATYGHYAVENSLADNTN